MAVKSFSVDGWQAIVWVGDSHDLAEAPRIGCVERPVLRLELPACSAVSFAIAHSGSLRGWVDRLRRLRLPPSGFVVPAFGTGSTAAPRWDRAEAWSGACHLVCSPACRNLPLLERYRAATASSYSWKGCGVLRTVPVSPDHGPDSRAGPAGDLRPRQVFLIAEPNHVVTIEHGLGSPHVLAVGSSRFLAALIASKRQVAQFE